MRPRSAAYVSTLKMALKFIGEEEELATVMPPLPPIVEILTNPGDVFLDYLKM